jgi:hypothetical protein
LGFFEENQRSLQTAGKSLELLATAATGDSCAAVRVAPYRMVKRPTDWTIRNQASLIEKRGRLTDCKERGLLLFKRLKRQSDPGRNLSSMWRNLLGGNACRGEPFDVNGYGKCSVGEPAEGSFIILCMFFLNKSSFVKGFGH